MKRNDPSIDNFLRGYLDAALFTTDTEPPGGMDYVESGRSEEHALLTDAARQWRKAALEAPNKQHQCENVARELEILRDTGKTVFLNPRI